MRGWEPRCLPSPSPSAIVETWSSFQKDLEGDLSPSSSSTHPQWRRKALMRCRLGRRNTHRRAGSLPSLFLRLPRGGGVLGPPVCTGALAAVWTLPGATGWPEVCLHVRDQPGRRSLLATVGVAVFPAVLAPALDPSSKLSRKEVLWPWGHAAEVRRSILPLTELASTSPSLESVSQFVPNPGWGVHE